MSTFPLPISNNFKLFNYTFKNGAFSECCILWPAKFLKDSEEITPGHVFILKNRQNHYFFALWKWNSREPELLLTKFWDKCFKKELHTSASNRYLFEAHGQSLLLPYVPHSLHKKWKKSSIEERDDSFVASYFQKYFDLGIFEGNKKKRFERFAGWQKKQIKNIANEYVKYVATKTEGCVPINLNKRICDLTKDEKKLLDNACALLHTIFPSFCTTSEQ